MFQFTQDNILVNCIKVFMLNGLVFAFAFLGKLKTSAKGKLRSIRVKIAKVVVNYLGGFIFSPANCLASLA